AADRIRTLDLTCSGGTPSNPCGVPPLPNSVSGGFGIIDGPLDHVVSHRDAIRAEATLFSGPHELRAGGGYSHGASDATYTASGGQEVFILNGQGTPYYAHFFAVRSLTDLTPVAGVSLRAQSREFGAYFQDSWRAAAGLTVNVGLRWDFEQLFNYQGVKAFSLGNEWQPRIGIVWDPWKDGRTKFYAFMGRFYSSLPTMGTGWAFHDFPFVETYNFDPVSLAMDTRLPYKQPACQYGCGGVGESGDPFDMVDRNLKGTYQDELSFGAERMLTPTLTMGVKATYRRLGSAVEDRCDFGSTVDGNTYTRCALVNPGSDEKFAHGDAPVCNGYDDVGMGECTPTGPATPPARRIYRGIEL